MNFTRDLNLNTDIIPLFDYTLNPHSKSLLVSIFQKPLSSIELIEFRQSILRGFVLNSKFTDTYNYSFLTFNNVHSFLMNWSPSKIQVISFNPFVRQNDYRDYLHQAVLFFNKLEQCFQKIDLSVFPKKFQTELNGLITILSNFNLGSKFASKPRNRLNRKQVKMLNDWLNELHSSNTLKTFWDNLFMIETYISISQGISKQDFHFPKIGQESIHLKNAFFPLIQNPIKNSFVMDYGVAILNGPNMSGKSTFLKTIGLCSYLGNLGLAIPADRESLIPLCDCFTISINKIDDVASGYSHFMKEIKTLKQAAERSKQGEICFSVFDEMFNGTDVDDATILIEKTVLGVAKAKNSFFFLSTHIKALNKLKGNGISHYYMDSTIDEDITPKLSYKIKQGWSTVRIGQIIFEKEGLNRLLD